MPVKRKKKTGFSHQRWLAAAINSDQTEPRDLNLKARFVEFETARLRKSCPDTVSVHQKLFS